MREFCAIASFVSPNSRGDICAHPNIEVILRPTENVYLVHNLKGRALR